MPKDVKTTLRRLQELSKQIDAKKNKMKGLKIGDDSIPFKILSDHTFSFNRKVRYDRKHKDKLRAKLYSYENSIFSLKSDANSSQMKHPIQIFDYSKNISWNPNPSISEAWMNYINNDKNTYSELLSFYEKHHT